MGCHLFYRAMHPYGMRGFATGSIYWNLMLPTLGYTSTADMFKSWVSCEQVGIWLNHQVPFVSATSFAVMCNTGIEAAGDLIESQIAASVKTNGTLTLKGSCTAASLDPDNVAHAITNGQWQGNWGESDGATGNVTGTFTGTLKK